LDLSPAEIGKAVTDWIQEMLIDEFGYDFLMNLFNDETTTGRKSSFFFKFIHLRGKASAHRLRSI